MQGYCINMSSWMHLFLLLIQGQMIFCSRGIKECSRSFYGFDYRGKVSTTRSGFTCQAWNSQTPHTHGFTQGHMFADGSVHAAKNYCRNPNERAQGLWCYTNNPWREWELCDIPSCSSYPDCRLTEGGEGYRGFIAVTKSGQPCAHWDAFPMEKGNSSLDGNYCRNPDGKEAPWCYVQGIVKNAWEFCDVPFCKPPMHCIPATADYSSFVGTLSVTENGRTCQRWSLQTPNKHDFTDDGLYPDGSAEDADNYCRNPDGDENGVWCYTTDPSVRWEYCNLPRCDRDCKITKAGREYSSTKNVTINGLHCQRWDTQSPHPHNMTTPDRFPDANASMAENYCRNPDGRDGGPWCYTTSENITWEHCGIPDCPHDTDNYPRTPRAKHVLHIGVDGLHPDCMKTTTFGAPNILRNLAQRGMYTYNKARTVINTKSGPGWSTILCGQGIETSGVTDNSWKPVWQGNKQDICPVNGESWPFPCVFEGLKSQDQSIHTAFFYDWPWLRYFANSGIPGSVDYDHICGAGVEMYPVCDPSIIINATAYLKELVKTTERSYTFVYLGNVDTMGHTFSWCSFMYGLSVSYADSHIGWLLNAVDSVDNDDFLVMLSTDHGGGDKRHGRQMDSDIRVPLFIRGPGVPANSEFPYTVQTRDMVPTAVDFLGLRQNPWWTGRPLKETYQKRKTTGANPK